MFYGDNVQDTRKLFFSSWKKYIEKQTLLPLEQQIVDVILKHPEYHPLLSTANPSYDQAYFPELGETNPFLHMGFHLAVRDQIAINRPVGIAAVYKQLLLKYIDPQIVEHMLMECFAECLWEGQRNQCPPDEQGYLRALQQLCK